MTNLVTAKNDDIAKEYSAKIDLLRQQMTDYFTNEEVLKNLRDPANPGAGGVGRNAAAPGGGGGRASLNDILESPEFEDLKKRMLRSEADINTLR